MVTGRVGISVLEEYIVLLHTITITYYLLADQCSPLFISLLFSQSIESPTYVEYSSIVIEGNFGV